MKKAIIIGAVAVTVGILALIFVPYLLCDDNELVGKWESYPNMGSVHEVEFKRNGNGVELLDTEEHYFKWSAENGILTLDYENGQYNGATVEYKVEGDKLEIIKSKVVSFIRID